MISDELLLDENIDTTLHVWIDLNRQNVILTDTADAGFESRMHHTDYVKSKPGVFGLSIEDVAYAQNVRDETLLIKTMTNGFVRGVIRGDHSEIDIEGLSLRDVYKALRIIFKNYEVHIEKLYIDIRNKMNPDAYPQSFVLDGKKMEIFMNKGIISSSRMLETYQEDEDGSFTHDGDDYDLNGILRATEDLDETMVSTDKLDWILDHDKLDFHRLVSADVDAPILITKWRGKYVVIDGLHRLASAIIQQKNRIKAKLVPKELLVKFKLT